MKIKMDVYRRRRLCALAILLAIFLLINWSIFLLKDYRYAGKNKDFEKSNTVYEEGSPVLGDSSKFLTDILVECKEMVYLNRELNKNYPFLNWDRVGDVSISFCKVIELSNGQMLQDEITAKYYSTDNIILVMEGDSVVLDVQYLKRVLIHELMHTLTYSNFLSSNILSEAIAEKFTEKICNENKIPFTYSLDYTYHVWAYDALENVFGSEKLVFMSYYGFLTDIIDMYTKKGFGDKFFNVLENLDTYERETKDGFFKRRKCEKMIRVAEDIMVHLTHSYIFDKKNNCDVETAIANCKTLLITDEKYFIKRLETREKEHK